MSLSERDREDLRVLELIIRKDPAAVARVMSLAESVVYSRNSRVKGIADALRFLGSQASCDALMAIWTVELFDAPEHLRALRSYLSRHIFSVCATVRRIALYTESSRETTTRATLLAILDKLGLAFSLSTSEGPELPALFAAFQDGRHLFHDQTVLRPAFALSAEVAESWQLNPSVCEDLRSLANWEGRVLELGDAPQLVLAAEVMLDAKAGLGNDALAQEPYASWPVIKALYANDIDPMSRVSLL
jgi:HD-like signal output (HDOD) protein